MDSRNLPRCSCCDRAAWWYVLRVSDQSTNWACRRDLSRVLAQLICPTEGYRTVFRVISREEVLT